MQPIPNPLSLAQAELQRAEHDQDLIEIPKRAKLDREVEGQSFPQPPAARPAK
jgi:hypothetical protein